MAISAVICGHTVCKHLQVDIQAGYDARMLPPFDLKETAQVSMFRKGSNVISSLICHDMVSMQWHMLDILILLLGNNDIWCDTSIDEIANHLIALAITQLHKIKAAMSGG